MQLSLTACLFGLSAGQVLAGPLSDALGRKRPLLVGLLLYTLASIACALALSILPLVVFRALQGMTGAAGVVISRAIARDHFSGTALAQFFSLLILVTGLAPILAPVLGGQVLLVTGWRGIFSVLSVFGLLMAVVVLTGLRESLPPERRRTGGLRDAVGSYGVLAADRYFLALAAVQGLAFATMFAYIAASPFVLQDRFGVSAQAYGILFGINAIGVIGGAQVNGRLVRRVAPPRILRVALGVMVTATTILLVVALTGVAGLPGLLGPLFVSVASLGFVLPNSTSLALVPYPERAGAASAFLGATQFLVAALVTPLVGLAGSGSPIPMATVMTATAVGAALTLRLAARHSR